MNITLSTLKKMWILDIDGTIFFHNSHLEDEDRLIPSFMEFYKKIDNNDYILLVSAREKKYKKQTLNSLSKFKIRYDHIIFNAPHGERILINDIKPKGLNTAIAINTKRDKFKKIIVKYDNNI